MLPFATDRLGNHPHVRARLPLALKQVSRPSFPCCGTPDCFVRAGESRYWRRILRCVGLLLACFHCYASNASRSVQLRFGWRVPRQHELPCHRRRRTDGPASKTAPRSSLASSPSNLGCSLDAYRHRSVQRTRFLNSSVPTPKTTLAANE